MTPSWLAWRRQSVCRAQASATGPADAAQDVHARPGAAVRPRSLSHRPRRAGAGQCVHGRRQRGASRPTCRGSIRSGSRTARPPTTSSASCCRSRSFRRCPARSCRRRQRRACGEARRRAVVVGAGRLRSSAARRCAGRKRPSLALAPAKRLTRLDVQTAVGARVSRPSSARSVPSPQRRPMWIGATCSRAAFTRSSDNQLRPGAEASRAMPNARPRRRG